MSVEERGRTPSLLVVTPCSSHKRPDTDERATAEELETEEGKRAAFRRLARWGYRSQDLYCGRHHLSVLRSLRCLREGIPDGDFGLSIISAGYGALSGSEWIVPYDVTFAGMSRRDAKARAERLGICQQLAERARGYQVALFLLGRDYLEVINAPLGASPIEVYFAPTGAELAGAGVVHVPAGKEQAHRLRTNTRMVKAELFSRFVDLALRDGWGVALTALTHGELVPTPGTVIPFPDRHAVAEAAG